MVSISSTVTISARCDPHYRELVNAPTVVRISLYPTDELGQNGYQFLINSRVRDLKGLVQDGIVDPRVLHQGSYI